MKICYVAPDVMMPYPSGASTHVIELAKSLASLGDEVHVVCRRRAGQPKEDLVSGISVLRLFRGILGTLPMSRDSAIDGEALRAGGVNRFYITYLRTVFALYAGLEVAQTIRKNGLEVIIERETAFGAGAIAAIATGRPMVLEQIGPRYSPLSMEKCHRLFAYSESMVPRWARSKAMYVNAAVDTNVFHPDKAARVRIRERYGVGETTLVGYVGTFQKWHGIQDLLKAARGVIHEVKDVRLLLVGSAGHWVSELAEELGVSAKTIFTGPVSYREVPDYINACDILVAPYNTRGSEREEGGIGSPLKVLEYMACGKTTIGTSLPQLKTLIRSGTNGVLFPPGNVEEFSESVLQLVRNPALRENFERMALETVRGAFTWKVLAEQIHSALVEALNS